MRALVDLFPACPFVAAHCHKVATTRTNHTRRRFLTSLASQELYGEFKEIVSMGVKFNACSLNQVPRDSLTA